MSLAGFKPEADKIVESIKKELSANIEEVDKRIAGGDENAVFGNVGYHKRQAVDLRARLEDLGQDVMRRRITPSHLEEVISLKTPFFRIFFYLNSTLRTSDYPSSPSLRTFDVTYLVLNI